MKKASKTELEALAQELVRPVVATLRKEQAQAVWAAEQAAQAADEARTALAEERTRVGIFRQAIEARAQDMGRRQQELVADIERLREENERLRKVVAEHGRDLRADSAKIAQAEQRTRQQRSAVDNAHKVLEAAQAELWAAFRSQQTDAKASISARGDEVLADVQKAGNDIRVVCRETRLELERLVKRAGVELKLKGGKRGRS